MITIIDGIGNNLSSLTIALKRLGANVQLTRDAQCIRAAEKVILPGVGHFDRAMCSLENAQLIDVIRQLQVPVLGICVGMQILFAHSDEGTQPGLGIIPGLVTRLSNQQDVVLPHMGWNQLSTTNPCQLLDGIQSDAYFYFVHSYAAKITPYTAATCDYSRRFTAVVAKDNFMGVQYHPEKSARVGERLLTNFLEM